MNGPRENRSHQREGELLNAALEQPPGEAAAFLDRASGQDAALRRRLERLLAAHRNASAFLEEAAAPGAPDAVPSKDVSPYPHLALPTTIGRYKLLEKIGEGGCGIVYMAEQEEPAGPWE